jgi:hypothetical protein
MPLQDLPNPGREGFEILGQAGRIQVWLLPVVLDVADAVYGQHGPARVRRGGRGVPATLVRDGPTGK